MPTPHRILLIIGSMREGGSENQVVLLMHGLKKRGHQVALMLLHYEGVRLQELLDEGFLVYDVKLPRFRPKWNPLPWLKLPFVLARSARFIRIWQPTILHAWLLWAHLWARLCLLFLRPIPLVTSRRQTAHPGPLRRIESWINDRAHAVVANSKAVLNSVRQLETNLPHQLIIIPNGIDIERIDITPPRNLREEFPLLKDASHIAICVANLLPVKDYPNLLRAWAQVAARSPKQNYSASAPTAVN